MLRRELEAPSTERRGGGGSRSVITTWSGSARVLPPASRRGSCTHRFAVVLSGPCLLVYLCLSFCSSSCLSKQAPFCLLNLVWSVSFVSSLFLSACLPVPNSTHGFALISSGPCLPVSLSLFLLGPLPVPCLPASHVLYHACKAAFLSLSRLHLHLVHVHLLPVHARELVTGCTRVVMKRSSLLR